MGKIAFNRIIIVFIMLLMSTTAWAQTLPSAGNNTYSISNAADWAKFVSDVNGGYSYSGKTVKLTADIGTNESPITTMVGVWNETESNRKPFSGTFTGEGHVLTIDYNKNTEGDYSAPFICTNGATIKQLTVCGEINTSVGNAAGLIGTNYGNKTKIQNNVTISVNISDGKEGNAGDYCAGVVVDATNVEISSCVYNGKILANRNSAGFCATGASTTKFNNCLLAPADGSSVARGENFMNGTFNTNSNRYYYATQIASSTQGSRVYTTFGDVPDTGFWLNKQLYDNNYYYVKGTGAITGLLSQYYQSNAQNGGFTFTVTYTEGGSTENVDESCYNFQITDRVSGGVVNINTIEVGDYTLTVIGEKPLCKGEISANFEVIANFIPNGSGTQDDPYRISSNTDWNAFADAVNNGHTFFKEYLKLTDDVRLTINNDKDSDKIAGVVANSSAGTAQKWFSGTFDGDWHIMTFNVGTNETGYIPGHNYSPSSPFRAIDGATIKNMTVVGEIYSTKKYNSGLVGYTFNTNTGLPNYIISCTSSIIIDCKFNNSPSDCSSAGFVAENKQGSVHFTNCIFNGKIEKGSNHSTGEKGAGYVSYSSGNKMSFTNCTMAGIITLTGKYSTFWRNNSADVTNTYYVINYGGVTGCTQASTTEPTTSVARKYVVNAQSYYVPGGVVTGFGTTTYSYIEGESVTIDAPTVEYYGRTLQRGTDYNIYINNVLTEGDLTLSAAGNYTFKISGAGDYAGSQSFTIKMIDFSSWDVLQEVLADDSNGDRDITLNANVTPNVKANEPLRVNGTVVLNLNGKTIDRALTDSVVYGQVIRINSGANLTINGPGTIKGGFNYPGTDPVPGSGVYYDKRDGGGIHNMGHLVLNNVDIKNNTCVKEAWGSESYAARGGAIYSGSGSSLIINGGNIESNEARGGGGGVFSEGANPFTMDGVTIYGNQSESKGGGVRVKTTGSNVAEFTDCYIYLNLATAGQGEGGGVYMEGGELHMTRCEIMGNQSRYRGCGFHSARGKTIAKDCAISYNGSFSVEDTNLGGGICLCDNKGSDHSIYIMDGGIVEGNNSNANGGGIYVYDGAVFQIMGNVQILDNYMASVSTGATSNNTYLVGGSIIEVIGPLDPDAIINITPNPDHEGAYVVFSDGSSSGDHDEDLSHFILDLNNDNDDYNMIIDDDGNVIVYEPYPWNETATWDGTIAENSTGAEALPTDLSDVTLHRTLVIKNGVTAYANKITVDQHCMIIIEDGAQLITNSSAVVRAEKNITAADEATNAGWYLISSTVTNPIIDENTNLVTDNGSYYWPEPTYDLYRFNEAADLQWENYRAGHADFTTLQNGRGYLYRNADNHKIVIDGDLNAANVTYRLSYTSGDMGTENKLKGFNIIGNPYSHTIYKGDDKGLVQPAIPNGKLLESKYYVLNTAKGEWILTDDGTAIPPMTGILVQAKMQILASAYDLTMRNSTDGAAAKDGERAVGKDANKNIWFTVSGNDFEDKACVEFREGRGLNKMTHQNEDAPMLYINYNDEDFASVDMNKDIKQINLHFDARTTGFYTLNIEPQGYYGYLHLIDKVAEKDIDLLEKTEYSFVASSSDRPDRFLIRLNASDDSDDSENFAYQCGNDIIVSGYGELQIFDITGRHVMTQHINGVEMVAKPSTTGVYIFRLNEKTQKMVVR